MARLCIIDDRGQRAPDASASRSSDDMRDTACHGRFLPYRPVMEIRPASGSRRSRDG